MIAKLRARRYAGSWPRAIRHYHASRGTETVDHERWPGARTDRIAGIFKVSDQAAIIVLYRARIAAIVEHRARVIGTPRGFVIEGTAIHDIDAEILTTGNHTAGQRSLVNLVGAAGNRKYCQNGGNELGDAKTASNVYWGAVYDCALPGHYLHQPRPGGPKESSIALVKRRFRQP